MFEQTFIVLIIGRGNVSEPNDPMRFLELINFYYIELNKQIFTLFFTSNLFITMWQTTIFLVRKFLPVPGG